MRKNIKEAVPKTEVLELPLFSLLFLLLLCVSCKTMPLPETPDPMLGESAYIPLEPGAQVYMFADVQRARPVLNLLPIKELSQKQSKEILDRTNSAVAALYPVESGRSFQLVAWGAYPASQAGIAFGADKNWKKQRSAGGVPFWHSVKDRLSVALGKKQAFVVASVNDTPELPFSNPPGAEIPDGFEEFRRGSLIACWVAAPDLMIGRLLTAMKIPLQLPANQIFISIFPAVGQPAGGSGGKEAAEEDRRYMTVMRIQTESAVQARGLVSLFTLLRGFLMSGMVENSGPAALATALFANPPALDGQNLNFKSAALTESEMALLLSFLSI